jgi:hypothetical protein
MPKKGETMFKKQIGTQICLFQFTENPPKSVEPLTGKTA